MPESGLTRRELRDLYGEPDPLAASRVGLVADLLRHGRVGRYIWESKRIQGWIRGREAVALAQSSAGLPAGAIIVEIGSFLGCSTVILAGSRRLRGSGILHAIDPFSGSGDTFSAPIYQQITAASARSLRERFEENIDRAGLSAWVQVHQATALEVAHGWTSPIDMLYLDGDQSRRGARDSFLAWESFLRKDGLLAINNSADGAHPPDHDGALQVVRELVAPPAYCEIERVEAVTFAKKSGG